MCKKKGYTLFKAKIINISHKNNDNYSNVLLFVLAANITLKNHKTFRYVCYSAL